MERWKVNLYTLWVTQIISLMSFGLGLPFIPFYIQEMGVTDPNQIKLFTGILSTAPAVTMAIMAPIWGRLADKWGRKLMILRAMLAAVLVIGGMGLVRNVWQLVILRACQGLFTGTRTAATTFVAANTPKDRLSYALGLISSSTFIGYSIGPFIGGICAEYFGYRFSFFAGSGLMLIGFFLVLFMLVEDKSIIGIGKQQEESVDCNKEFKLFTPLILSLLLVLFLHRVTRSVFSPYIPLFVQSTLEGTEGAAKLTGVISGTAGLATALAGLTISRLGDRVNKVKLATTLILISFCISLTLKVANSLYIFIPLYGMMFFFLGGIEPIITSTTAENTPSERRGELFGFQGLVGSLGWMVSPMLGAYISVNYSIRNILLLIPLFMFINMIVLFKLSRSKLKFAKE
ncbi:MFS transporter [Wukongibacter baidiensis]|uniref:MFS transporter n=1 Tax=Wukongibacter baidiensis TaxID=1723361 RepID=UPI003D7F8059